MVLLKEKTSHVLVGIWNPAILSPEWLARHVFEVAEAEVQVEMLVPAGPGLPMSFTLQGVRFTPTRDRLTISPIEDISDDVLGRLQQVACRILELLPHTPVRATGLNFEFLEEQPNPEHVAIFGSANDVARTSDFPIETVSTDIRLSLQFENRLLNFARLLKDGKLRLNFNFHSQVQAAPMAAQQLQNRNLFAQNLAWSKRIIRNLYGLDL